MGQHTKAVADYTKVIELMPQLAGVYCARGTAYGSAGKPEEAKKDLLKALELDPALKPQVKKISDHYKLNLTLD